MNLYKAYTMPLYILIWCIAIMYGEMHAQIILTNWLYYRMAAVKPNTPIANLFDNLWPLLLTWFNFNPSMDK